MKTEKRLILEQKITEFLDNDSVIDNPEGYVHDEIIQDMADAAETVWDAVMKYQKFAIEQGLHEKE